MASSSPAVSPTIHKERNAVRMIIKGKCIAILESSEIAILWVEKGSYFKLPGGGINTGESNQVAIIREANEEVGCKVNGQGSFFATYHEHRDGTDHFNRCYLTTRAGPLESTALTDQEADEGMTTHWVDIEAALMLIQGATPTSELGKAIQKRDALFVEKALLHMQGTNTTRESY